MGWQEIKFLANFFFLQEIKLGESEVVLTAGTESMSQAPYAVRNARWGTALGVDLKVLSRLRELVKGLSARTCSECYIIVEFSCESLYLTSLRWHSAPCICDSWRETNSSPFVGIHTLITMKSEFTFNAAAL